MYCDLRPVTAPEVIMRKSSITLRTLPPPSEVTFPDAFAWSPVSSTTLTTALGADPGVWNTWRNRRLTPSPLPPAWFRRASGSPLVYQVSDILTWLAARRGEPLDTLDTWRHSLLIRFDTETDDPAQIRKLASLYARVQGPVIGDVRFTSQGFAAYLASLAA